MQWFDDAMAWLLKGETKKAARIITDNAITIGFGGVPEYVTEAGEVFKLATEQHKQGNHQVAIDLFNKAVKIYTDNDGLADVDLLLRLPNYLKALERKQEAWREYYNILAAYANYHENIRPMMFSKVYDKMRLFQQREKDFNRASVYEVLSYTAWRKGLVLQDRQLELADWPKPNNIDEYGFRFTGSKITNELKESLKQLVIDSAPSISVLDFDIFEKQALKFAAVK